jgi:aldose 1-epimerase
MQIIQGIHQLVELFALLFRKLGAESIEHFIEFPLCLAILVRFDVALHGGVKGFNSKIFDYRMEDDGITFSYDSPDMEEGYPGDLHVEIRYVLKGNTLGIIYSGHSDKDTIVNLTNHMYFNLSGEDTVLGHRLKIKSGSYMPVDDSCLVTGEFVPSKGTVFDFNELSVIGDHMDMDDPQIRKAGGFDHAFVLSSDSDQILLSDEKTGRSLVISTDMPMVHVYTGNYLSQGPEGADGSIYRDFEGIALETEYCPDSINIEEDPSVILRKGEKYYSETYYSFLV